MIQAERKDKEEKLCWARDEKIDLSQTFLNHEIDFKCHSDSLKKKNSVDNLEIAMHVSLRRR